MSLKSIRSDLLVRHALVTLARYLDKAGIDGSIHSHALILDAPTNGNAERAVCYFAFKSKSCDGFDPHISALVVVLRPNAVIPRAINSEIYAEAQCPDLLDCPREIIEILTPTSCQSSRLWRRKCLSMRFAEQYRELASHIPYEPVGL